MKTICLFLMMVLPVAYLSPVERLKPPPLSELQNKRSYQFVPIPYPKTREEIIVDLDYGLTQTYKGQYKEIVTVKVDPKDKVNDQQLVADYLSKAKGYRVGEIVKVYNKHYFKPFEFDYLIEVLGPDGIPVFRNVLEASGRWHRYSRSVGHPWSLLKRQFSDDRRIIALLKKVNITEDELNLADRYDFHGLSSTDNPAKRIVKDHAVYFISSSHRLYRLREKIKDRGDEALRKKMHMMRAGHTHNRKSNVTAIHDTVDDQFLILEEIR